MKRRDLKLTGVLIIMAALLTVNVPVSVYGAGSISEADFKLDKDKLVKYTGTDSNVKVPAGVKAIGQEAFADCTHVTNVVLPKSLETIENGAFSGCSKLTSITIPEGTESIGNGAFAECTSLSSVSLPQSLIDLGYGVFAGDSSLSTVSIAKDNEYFLVKDGALYNDDMTALYQVFAGRKGATFAMPNSVEEIKKYAFWGCEDLRQVGLSSHLEAVGDFAFSNASGLVTISLPFSARAIGIKAFEDCRELTDVLIPISVTRIDPTAFDGCYNINIIADDGTIAAKYYEDYLTKQKLKEEYEEGYEETGVNPHKIIISDDASVESEDSTKKDGVYVRDPKWYASDVDNYVEWDVDSPGVLGRSKVVSKRAVVLFDSKNGTVIDGSDGSVHGGGDVSNDVEVVDAGAAMKDGRIISRAFYMDDELKNVSIPSDCTEIGDFAFARTKINNVIIPQGVKKICQGAFYHCDDLYKLTIPSSVTEIEPDALKHTGYMDNWLAKASDNSFMIVGDGIIVAYKGSKNVVKLPTTAKRIAPSVFKGHEEITEINIPDSITYIGESAFEDCINLRNVSGGNKVTKIADKAFYNCPLTTVRIPASVKEIGQKAFGGTDATSSAVIMGEKMPVLTYEKSATRLYNPDNRGSAFYGIDDVIVLNSIGEKDMKGSVIDISNKTFKGNVYELSDIAGSSNAKLIAKADPDVESASSIKAYNKNHKVEESSGLIIPDKEKTVSDNSVSGLMVVDHKGLRKSEITLSKSGATVNTDGYHFYISEADKKDKEELKDSIQEYLGNASDSNTFYMDISMYDPTDTIPMKKLGKSALTLSMPVPAELVNKDVCIVSLDDNGLPDITYVEYEEKGGREFITFPIEHCSAYAIYAAGGDLGKSIATKRSNPSGREGLDDTPDTGDHLDPKVVLLIGLVTLGCAMILALSLKKRK